MTATIAEATRCSKLPEQPAPAQEVRGQTVEVKHVLRCTDYKKLAVLTSTNEQSLLFMRASGSASEEIQSNSLYKLCLSVCSEPRVLAEVFFHCFCCLKQAKTCK